MGAGVVGVEVGEHDLPQLARVMPGLADGGANLPRGAGEAGVDGSQAAGVGAQVGVPDGEAQVVQAGTRSATSMPATVSLGSEI